MWLFRSQDPSVDSRPLGPAAQASSYGTADHAEVRIFRFSRNSWNFGRAHFEKQSFGKNTSRKRWNRIDVTACVQKSTYVLAQHHIFAMEIQRKCSSRLQVFIAESDSRRSAMQDSCLEVGQKEVSDV